MQGVQDVVGFAKLCFQQLEIAVEKFVEFLKEWLDFGDFQVSSAETLCPTLTAGVMVCNQPQQTRSGQAGV